MTNRQALVAGLTEMSDKGLDDIERSLRGDDPILIGKWYAMIDQKWCGCLMMDGHANDYHSFISNATPKDSLISIKPYLAKLYELSPAASLDILDYLALAFDKWARERRSLSHWINLKTNQVDMPVIFSMNSGHDDGYDSITHLRILSKSGRKSMIKILKEARNAKADQS